MTRGAADVQMGRMREALVENLTLEYFSHEEIQDVLREIDSHDARVRQKILAFCLSLSQSSSELVQSNLKRFREAAQKLSVRAFERWLTQAFDLLDAKGITAALPFLLKVDPESLDQFRSPSGLSLQDVASFIETFLRGLSAKDLRVDGDRSAYTDTATVFLPEVIDQFGEPARNLLMYKLIAAHKWAQIRCDSLTPGEEWIASLLDETMDAHPDLDSLFRLFGVRRFAIDLYSLLDAIRLDPVLNDELPGMMRDSDFVRKALMRDRPCLNDLGPRNAVNEWLYRYYLGNGAVSEQAPEPLGVFLGDIADLRQGGSAREAISLVFRICDAAEDLGGEYDPESLDFFLGTIRPDRVSWRLGLLRQEERKRIEGIITRMLTIPDFDPQRGAAGEASYRERPLLEDREYLVVSGRLIEVDETVREIIEERGSIPGGILVKGGDLPGGRAAISLRDLTVDSGVEAAQLGGIRYDEWDYRRGDYRKDWCSIYEKDLFPGSEPFVEKTLRRYSGYVSILRKKFELLKREPRMVRRQREGDGIDIDAVVEAMADLRAGLTPSEDLFTRFDRQERNIAVLFLLDMSGSTKGWVNISEKEALVMMSEALEALGDRYAIYGFSGMTRTKCDYYRIKGFSEPYGDAVRKRIAGIRPMDYTRMGAPIRHSIGLLSRVDARTRLLIALSDGKPEDWDAYKGDYAIEDTRKALLEAREAGIHSFCISIDVEAQNYLPHMYGEGRYVFIDDVRRLPNRITDIYRRLTA